MKNLIFILGILLGFTASANHAKSDMYLGRGYDGNAYIFVEGDVEFSVFPDGQFDFVYIGPRKNSQVTISGPHVNITFNSGYNYDAYVQYDDYGAVIQVENVPIFYDFYGRIVRAGNVDIRYNNRRLVRVGGLHIIYNNYGYFSHYTGYINPYNRYYVYRPWHNYYVRPIYTHVIVYDYPYRQYYHPIRYSYHDHIRYYANRNNIAYHNGRREFHRPGSRIHQQNGSVVRNKDYDPNRQNTMIATTGRNVQSGRNNMTEPIEDSRSNPRSLTSNNDARTTRKATADRVIRTTEATPRTSPSVRPQPARTQTASHMRVNSNTRSATRTQNTESNIRNTPTPTQKAPRVSSQRTSTERTVRPTAVPNRSTARSSTPERRNSTATNTSRNTSNRHQSVRSRG